MPIRTGNENLDSRANALLLKLGERMSEQVLLNSKVRISETLAHDFAEYKFVQSPKLLRFPNSLTTPTHDGSDVDVGIWIEFEDFARAFKVDISDAVIGWWFDEATVNTGFDVTYYQYPGDEVIEEDYETIKVRRTQTISISGYEGFRVGLAPELFTRYVNTLEPERFLDAAQHAVSDWLKERLASMRKGDGSYEAEQLHEAELPSFWDDAVSPVLNAIGDFPNIPDEDIAEQEFGDTLPDQYSFEPFLPDSINFGVQILYRQGWTPLGTQAGEIVRTIPLGPKQSEKISVKVLRRTKAMRSSEIVTSSEMSTESSAATKDSSEIIQEASETFNWHVEASASAGFGFGSGSVKSGAGGKESASSRDTKRTLNEAMEKSAAKVRKDTKITISTEKEDSSEFQQTSNISNPNDEMAVTYIYSRLQRQYEIQTYLSELNAVVFVAERIPAPKDINGSWIRRYDWILSRVLLDDSFNEDLTTVCKYDRANSEIDEIDDNIRRLMETLSGEKSDGIPDYSALPGDLPDLFQNQQQAYERELERRRLLLAERQGYQHSLGRLRRHIFDNILHYCRAIWSAEDPDARLMRYRKMRVPVKWDLHNSKDVGKSVVRGSFLPSVSDPERDTVALSEMINPAGPIGFAGNYAVYYLKESRRWASLNSIIGIFSAPYLKTVVNVDKSHPDNISVYAVASDLREGNGQYRVTLRSLNDEQYALQIEIKNDSDCFEPISDTADIFMPDSGLPIEFDGVRIWLSIRGYRSTNVPYYARNIVLHVDVKQLPILEDPELKAIRYSTPLLDESDAPDFFTPDVISEMRRYFSKINSALSAYPEAVDWSELSKGEHKLLRSFFHEYLLRKKHTRRFLVDTNNIFLTMEVDRSSTLEPYKGLHRMLDVLSASEDLTGKMANNLRLRKRLEEGLYGDPDVDKVTVISGVDKNTNVSELVAFDELDSNSSELGISDTDN